MGLPGNRDLPLLHRLQERTLGLGGGAVHFVGEDDVVEHRPAVQDEMTASVLIFRDQAGAGDVGGHQVRRELDPGEGQRECVANRLDQQRLAQSGHPFEQDIAAADQPHQGGAHDPRHADDDLVDAVLQCGEGPAEGLGIHGHGAGSGCASVRPGRMLSRYIRA